MPYKDKEKRYEAIRKSVAKKPELYKALGLNNKRKAHRRGYMIQRRYGLSMESYMKILEEQNNGCAICGRMPPQTKSGRCGLQVDHNHSTNKVRGLLCARCNSLVGHLERPNGIEIIKLAGEYIENHS
jgi:hypothetical protein